MPLLYYWRRENYYRDLAVGLGFNLNQKNPILHDIDPGDSLWAFTRRQDGCYVLAAELVVASKTMNPPGFHYGPYRIWGDLHQSRYFALDAQSDITTLIRGLSVPAGGKVLGQAFQGNAAVRRLTPVDHLVLAAYAQDLPLEPRARLLPEERLEAVVQWGDEASVRHLIKEESPGYGAERKRYLIEVVKRNRELVATLQDLYDGMCQMCLWSPRSRYDAALCEGHHVRWLSQGGDDALSNMVLVCPNHHRAIHGLEARFDWSVRGFNFRGRLEPLQREHHELVP